MNFQYFSPTILIVGPGRVRETGELAAAYGRKPMIVATPSALSNGALTRAMESLAKAGLESRQHIKPPGEPDLAMVDQAVKAIRQWQCDSVISIGGGAAIDLAKAAAGIASNGGQTLDYLEGVGAGKAITVPALPHIAIPTTAGAGAEVTRNAVISSREGRFKKSMRSPYLCPLVAILDAELTADLPPSQTAYSGMDAITQLIEAFLSKKATPMTDALARLGMNLAFGAIREVYHNGSNVEKRADMLLASTLSGMCLANAGLGMAHGFAAGLGALHDVPHGKACAIMLPHAMRRNMDAARERIAEIGGYCAHLPGMDAIADPAERAVAAAEALCREFNIPSSLKTFAIPPESLPDLAKKSMGNSMSGNPVVITQEGALAILQELTA